MEEMMNPGQQTSLIRELKQGKDLANQLKKQLHPINSRQTCQQLLHKILSTYDKALSVLDCSSSSPSMKKRHHHDHNHNHNHDPSSSLGNEFFLDSSSSSSSLSTDDSSKDQNDVVYKKRKTQPRWSEQVRVCSGTGPEGLLFHDGHSWRKYGQKDILGAKFPRAYYRCTHRNTQGCLATKQVQRTDDNSSIFEVTYRGRHTCIHASSTSSASKLTSTVNKISNSLLLKETEDNPNQDKVFNLGEADIKVETPDLMNTPPPPPPPPTTTTTTSREEIFPSFPFPFPFPFTPTESESLETQFFSNPLEENDLMVCYSPSSASNYYCNIDDFIICSITEKSESDLTDSTATATATPTPTSVSSSPFGDLEISFDQGDFPLEAFALS